jgi:hypothetical protein
MAEGWWNMNDCAAGIIYEDGRVQMYSQDLSDERELIEWLNTIHPITEIE